MRACTVIGRNYLAHARVFARSITDHHPGARAVVLVLDDPGGALSGRGEPFDVLRPADLDLDPATFGRMAAMYTVTELATAVKPWLLRHLLGTAAAVVFLDPDVEVHAPLDDIGAYAAEHSIVLTPHTTEPMPRDQCSPDELQILRSGIYNLGFVAVGAGAKPFLEWWQERLRHDCVVSVDEGLFVDQRWADFVPGYFDHYILRDPGVNVAYWNLGTRTVTATEDGYQVDGRPLRVFHFSGFDPDTPYLLSRHQGDRPRVLLSEHPAVAELCARYGHRLRAEGYDRVKHLEYGYARTAGGLRLDPRLRRLFRRAVVDAERAGTPPPPDAFDLSHHGALMDWLRAPAEDAPSALVSRFVAAVYDHRPDLRQAYPDPTRPDGLLAWLRAHGEELLGLPPELLPDKPRPQGDRAVKGRRRHQPGVNVAGYVFAESGVGEGARSVVAALQQAGVPWRVVPFTATPSRQNSRFDDMGDADASYDTSIVCVNADQLRRFATGDGHHLFDGRYTIGLWHWEVEQFPDRMRDAAELVDEVWVCSRHAQAAVAPAVDRPVHTFPLPVVVPAAPGISRADLGLSTDFLFLFCFDFHSVVERKNPVGVVKAYTAAFGPGGGTQLVIKSMHGEDCLVGLERLRAAAGGRPDVVLIDETLDAERHRGLMQTCDAYVSLHRAEGFGLTMAEAMALGKPVVATAYSGNLDYMTAENSYLVAYELVAVPPGCDPYPTTARWAEPDLDAAARALRAVWDDPVEARRRGQRARLDIERGFSAEAAAGFIRDRLEDIRRPRRPAPTPAGDEPSDSNGRARALLERGPDVESPTRYGSVAHVARRVVSRGLRHYADHQAQVDGALLDKMAATEAQHQQEVAALHDRIARLEAHLGTVETFGRALAGQVAWIDDDIDAAPYTADPSALRTADGAGRTVIGYRAGDTAPGDGYVGFENLFRGAEEFIRERQRAYLDLIGDHRPVVDLGCGRGEMLDLLAAAGVPAVGVDTDEGMVARGRAKGHEVVQADAVGYLRARADGSIGTVFSAQFIEHVDPSALVEMLRTTLAKLRPGGLVIAETVNPHSLRALKTFWLDLTHQRPLFPEALVCLCRDLGFAEA
ncbi:MAG: methyltransferase domain-containing protein, partial [Acidimicrobiales bacterium]